MSEFWCDYEARTNWLQMYSIPNISSPEDESEEKESEEDLHEEIEEIETPRQTRSSVKRRKMEITHFRLEINALPKVQD